MSDLSAFLSVGATATSQQESFVRAVEDRLRSEGIITNTVGRNVFTADSPLKAVTELMDQCSGTVVVALERMYFGNGVEKRGSPDQTALQETKLPTPWNQIEAAMAYSRGHPLLMIVEKGLKDEGLLSRGYDWYVQQVQVDSASLNTLEFNGVLASWKQKMLQKQPKAAKPSSLANPSELTIAELVGGLKATQLWGVLVALAAIVAGAFWVGFTLHNGGKG
jgi:hypothetical protein